MGRIAGVEVPAPSRASPLPHSIAFFRQNAFKCGSGLAREAAGRGNAKPKKPPPNPLRIGTQQVGQGL